MRIAAIALLAISVTHGTVPVSAQDFPTKPIRVVVPQPPGGGFDLVGRTIADKMPEAIGQAIVVENRTGAGTVVGTDLVAKAAPDGYTLLVAGLPNISLNAGLYPKLPYDPLRDLVPVGLAVAFSYTLVSRKDLPLGSLKEIIEYARNNPEKLTYASGGNGTGQHLASAVLTHLTGVKMTHVPYKGAQAAYQDILAGRIDLFFDNASTARPQVDAGSVKAYAVSSSSRLPMHPNVPTVNETGVTQFDLESWFGWFAPAKTPAPILEKLRAAFAKTMQHPEVVGRFEKSGARVLRLSTADTEALVKRDTEKWIKLIRAANIVVDN